MALTEQERQKVRNALACLQQAQYLVDDAARELCSVNGFAREWSDLAKLHDQVKRRWHRIEPRRVTLQPPPRRVA